MSEKKFTAYLLTGSNEGDRYQQLSSAGNLIEKQAGKVVQASSIYETEAWGKEGLPPHLNQALQLETTFAPENLLKILQQIETQLGRVRKEKWGVRKIDIDIIYFENRIINRPELQIPHPFLHLRRFTLVPLAEISPDFQHPQFLKTNAALLAELQDPLKVTLYKSNS